MRTLEARAATTATITTRLEVGYGAYDPARSMRRKAGRVYSTMASTGALSWLRLRMHSNQIQRESACGESKPTRAFRPAKR